MTVRRARFDGLFTSNVFIILRHTMTPFGVGLAGMAEGRKGDKETKRQGDKNKRDRDRFYFSPYLHDFPLLLHASRRVLRHRYNVSLLQTVQRRKPFSSNGGNLCPRPQ